jgi:hypothetical protein
LSLIISFMAPSHCTYQVEVMYSNLCLDRTHFLNL